MTKQKTLIIIIFVVVAILSLLVHRFYRDNLRGTLPALLPPGEDITKLIPPTSNNPKSAPATNTTNMPLKLPDGFSIGIFAKDLGGMPRSLLEISDENMLNKGKRTLMASLTDAGKVIALTDTGNGSAKEVKTVISGLDRPHGIIADCDYKKTTSEEGFKEICHLYVAETDKVSVWELDRATAKTNRPRQILNLPTNGGGHFTRSLMLYYNNSGHKKLLTSIGSSCNVCDEDDPRRAAIYISNLDGSDFRVYAAGLRNSVFMVPNPATGQIWATEMGRDLLGDEIPPDEVNIIEADKNYGWPICYGKNIHDSDFDKNQYIQDPCNDRVASHIEIPAHSAPLGLSFIPDDGMGGWPEEWKNDLIVALHGSWNRSTPSGYKIIRYDLDESGNVLGSSDFLTGFIQSQNSKTALGRPVGIITLPGGIMYVSDDKAGVIYKIQYSK